MLKNKIICGIWKLLANGKTVIINANINGAVETNPKNKSIICNNTITPYKL